MCPYFNVDIPVEDGVEVDLVEADGAGRDGAPVGLIRPAINQISSIDQELINCFIISQFNLFIIYLTVKIIQSINPLRITSQMSPQLASQALQSNQLN